MYSLPESAEILIDEFAKLPGVGKKTAQRLTFFILKNGKQDALDLSKALVDVKEKIRYCDDCFGISESPLCSICGDPGRDNNILCVVENAYDVIVFEKTNA